MSTLQRTVIRNHDENGTNVKLEATFQIPVFRYFRMSRENTISAANRLSPIFREKTGSKSFKLSLGSEQDHYQLSFPAMGTIIQENDDENLYYQYQAQLNEVNGIDTEDLSFTVEVNFTNSETGEQLGKQVFEAIDIMRAPKALTQREGTERMKASGAYAADDAVFLVNKRAFNELIDDINLGNLTNTVIQLLAGMFAYKSRMPQMNMSADLEGSLTEIIRNRLESTNETSRDANEISQKFYKALQKHSSRLFDFPLDVAAVSAHRYTISGDLTIETAGNEIAATTLNGYEVTIEYTNGVETRVKTFNWNTTAEFLENHPFDFSFDIMDNIEQLLKLSVQGPSGELLWLEEYGTEHPVISQGEKVHIRVPLQESEIITGSPTANTQQYKKLRGRVIQQGEKHHLDNLTVLIQGKKDGDAANKILAAGKTDKSGNFSLNYPYGNFTEAQAIVSLMPNSPVDIDIVSEQENETISDDFLYILIADANVVESDGETEEDCDCKSPKKAKRLPDQEDLVYSDEYTQDIGGACINLTTPNRTLREFNYMAIVRTSDPEVSNYTLEKVNSGNRISYQLTGGSQTIKKNKTINLQNPIRWQDAPGANQNLSFYQAVSIATGHILHYKSVFKSDGYSLGDLLYSLPLAPGQKKQIVIFDSSHSLTGAESQTVSQSENLSANLVSDRAIIDEIGGGINEAMSGRSSASTAGISAGLGVGASMGAISGVLGVSGGYSNANSSASQNSSRNISQFFSERLRQSISQNAASYRQQNATVVTTVKQGQQYAVTTESVANHNHCHSLTMMYFEVLRHYAVFQELAAVEECVFVPLLMTNFTYENIFKWRDVLANHLLSVNSNTYLQPLGINFIRHRHPYLKGFDAIDRILTNYTQVDYPANRFADERITEVTGKMLLRINIPRPKTRFDRILSFPVIKKTVTTEGGVDVGATVSSNIKDAIVTAVVPCAHKGPHIVREQNSTEILTRGAIFDMFMTLDGNYETVPPAQAIRVNFEAIDVFDNPFSLFFAGDTTPTPLDFFAGMEKEKKQWEAYATILGMTVKELFKYFNNNVVADWDRIFNENIAPLILENLLTSGSISRISFVPLSGMDISIQGKYRGGERLMEVILRGTTSLRRTDVTGITINYNSPLPPGQLKNEFFNMVTVQLENLRLDYATAFSNNTILNRSLRDNLENGVATIPTPLNLEEKKNPRKEDIYIAEKLMEHLNSNLEYYNRSLWMNLDNERRYMLMDGFSIQIFNRFGNPIGYRSLASVIKNQLITVVGNSLVFPVAEGYRVSKTYIVAQSSDEVPNEMSLTEALFNHYKPLTPAPPYRISVPNRGVFLEAIQGSCDACEKVKPNSSQDWTKFGTEEPTSISPVVTPTPTITDWKAAFKEFATPLINIQNAPENPAPAAGLAALSELLGKAGIFNDITGLAGNQQNAMQTYLSNQENVKALAEMAKGMAMQQHNTANSDTIMSSLNNARESGALTPERHADLVSRHLEHQIDGGETRRTEETANREATRPSLTTAAVQAVSEGRRVTAQRTNEDGTAESVSIGDDNPEDTTRSVDLVNGSADRRAFEPSINRKSGEVTLQAIANNIAAPIYNWEVVGDSAAVGIINGTTASATLRALTPGKHRMRVSARSGATATVARPTVREFAISAPQFIRITEDATRFDNALTELGVLTLKNRIVQTIKTTADFLLSTTNLRTIWQLGGFAETVPSFIAADKVSVVTFLDRGASSGLTGHADPHNSGWGPQVFNERIEMYPAAYLDHVEDPDYGVDTETRALVLQLESMTMASPEMEDFAVKVYGRLLGSTLAHEILHSIIGIITPGFAHNDPLIPNDIMNPGYARNFTQRTGMVDNAHVSPVDPANFTDNGLSAMDRLQSANQAKVDLVFPINPS